MPTLNFGPVQNNNFDGTGQFSSNSNPVNAAKTPAASTNGAPVMNFDPVQNNNFPAPVVQVVQPTQTTGTGSSSGSAGTSQQTPPSLNSSQTAAQNQFLSALDGGQSQNILQIERNFGLSTNQLADSQIQALNKAAQAGEYILNPTVFAQVVSNAPVSSIGGNATSQSGSYNSVTGTVLPPPQIGSGQVVQNGYGQYLNNVGSGSTLTQSDNQALNQLLVSAQKVDYANTAASLPADSPYKAYYDQLAQWGYNPSLGTGQAFNSQGGSVYDLPIGQAYNYVAQQAALSGQQIPPQLASDLIAEDAYWNSHTNNGQYVFSATAPSGGTSFGSGDNSGYVYEPVTTTVTPPVTPGLTSAINPNEQSLARGGLFGDTISGGAQSYTGPGQPVITNTGTPYQPGVTDVTGAAARIVPAGTFAEDMLGNMSGTPPTSLDAATAAQMQQLQQLINMGNSGQTTQQYGLGNPAGTTPVFSPMPTLGTIDPLLMGAYGAGGASTMTLPIGVDSGGVYREPNTTSAPASTLGVDAGGVYRTAPMPATPQTTLPFGGLNMADGMTLGTSVAALNSTANTPLAIEILQLLNGTH